MAIAYDNAGSSATGSASTRTVNLAATGADRVAIIAVGWFSGTYNALSSLTVNNGTTGLEQIGSVYELSNDSRHKVALYRVIAPPTSAVDYVATWGGNVEQPALAVVTYTGVDQTTPITGSQTNNGNSSSGTGSVTVSSASGEVVVAAMMSSYPINSLTPDGAQNSRVGLGAYSGGEGAFGVSDKAGAASTTLTWTLGNGTTDSGRWAVSAIRLAEASGGPSAITRYNSFSEYVADGTVDLDTDTFKVRMVTGYTPSATHAQLSEVPSAMTGTTDTTMTGVTWTRSGGTATFNAEDTTVSFSSTGTPSHAIIYDDTSTNDNLVAYITLGSTQITAGNSMKLVWDAAGIFTLS